MENAVIINRPELLCEILKQGDEGTAVVCIGCGTSYADFGTAAKKYCADDMGRAKLKKMLSGAKRMFIAVKIDGGATYDRARRIIKQIIGLKKLCAGNKISFGISCGEKNYVGSVCCGDGEYGADIERALIAAAIDEPRQRCEYIYDAACDYLDERFRQNNYCDFRDNHCKLVRKYNAKDTAQVGCCHSYRLFRVLTVDFMYDHKPCRYMGVGGCTEKCLGCKLYTCDMLKKEGIRFSLDKMLLTDCFFSRKQKMVLKSNIFRSKQQVIDKTMQAEADKSPIWWYYLCGRHIIRTDFDSKYV